MTHLTRPSPAIEDGKKALLRVNPERLVETSAGSVESLGPKANLGPWAEESKG